MKNTRLFSSTASNLRITVCFLLLASWSVIGTNLGIGQSDTGEDGTFRVTVSTDRVTVSLTDKGHLKNGASTNSNRDYTLESIPEALEGLEYVQLAHDFPQPLDVSVRKSGTLYIGVCQSEAGNASSMPSAESIVSTGTWKKAGTMTTSLEDGTTFRWQLYSARLQEEDELLIQSANRWGTIVASTSIQHHTNPGPGAEDVPEDIAPIDAPFDMPDLERPEFPGRMVDVRDHGAVKIGGDEIDTFDFETDKRIEQTTEAINKAIRNTSRKGGGTVRVPAGHWVTGPIHLRSNVNLHIAEGAVVHFSEDISDYLPVVRVRFPGLQAYNYSPLIYARDVRNIAITGNGTLNGHAGHWQKWWRQSWKENGKKHSHGYRKHRVELAETPLSRRMIGKGADIEGMRPCFVTFYESRNILIEGVTVKNGPTWNIHPVFSENIIVRGVTVEARDILNGDGINPDSCRNVLIEHCTLLTGDDAVAIKSGLNEAGLRIDRPSENIVLRKYVARDARWGVAVGSEMSGGVRNVYAHESIHVNSGRGFNFKSAAGRGNVVENIYIEDMNFKGIGEGFWFYNTSYGGRSEGPVPLYRDFHIRDVHMYGANFAIRAKGNEKKWFRNFSFKNARFENVKSGIYVRNLHGLDLTNIAVGAKQGSDVVLENVTDASLDQIQLNGANPKVQVKGGKSKSIHLKGLSRDQVLLHGSLRDGTVKINDTSAP